MKKLLPSSLRSLLFSGILLLMHVNSYASHIVGAELRYKWVSGLTYQITMYIYGDCGSTTGAFNTLPIITPHICVYDGNTSIGNLFLSVPSPVCGTEVTPVCPDSLAFTSCTSLAYATPGVKKFVCSGNFTLPYYSANWRFIYTSDNGSTSSSWSCPGTIGTGSGFPSSAGRSAAITSITPGTAMQLIDTLNISNLNTRGHNSSPVLTVEPTPYFCGGNLDCYNPGAVDLFDVGPGEPAGDSLVFSLVNATNGNPGGCTIGGPVTYLFGLSGSNPLQLTSGTLAFSTSTGQMCFNPINQRSVVVYNIQEYRNDTDTVYNINTFAGNGTGGYTGDGLPAITEAVHDPTGITQDATGNIYFADALNSRIRKVNTAGIISTIAGTGIAGYSGDDSAATNAKLNYPMGMAIDGAGNLYFADMFAHVVRKISTTGIITTVAGTGVAGFFGDGAAATAAQLDSPRGVWVDGANNIYITDAGNERIRKINPAGIISTICGNGTWGPLGDGGLAIAPGCQVAHPTGIFVNANGIYFADADNNRIRLINGAGIISTVAGTGAPGYSGDGGPALAAALNSPTSVVLDPYGYMYIADRLNSVIRKVSPTGRIVTIAGFGVPGYSGDGGPALSALLRDPTFLYADPTQNIYFSDSANNRVRVINPQINVLKIKVGTMQREMTFRVQACSYTTPVSAIDSFSTGLLTMIDSFHVYGCANSGTFALHMNPHETDTSLHISCTATGLSAGFTFSVVGDGTSSPHVTVTGNTAIITPGTYVFYLTFIDNHCPLTGNKTYAFTVDILPVPNVRDTIVTAATCTDSAAVRLIPGGTGKPWTIKLSYYPSHIPGLDTFLVIPGDTGSVLVHLTPGIYYKTIFTSVSNNCHVGDTFWVDTPHFRIHAYPVNPTYCGASDGAIRIDSLNPGTADTLLYKKNGVLQARVPFVSSATGTDTLYGLRGAVYDSIVVQQGFCFTDTARPGIVTLVDPPFIWRTVTTRNTSKCGFANGIDTLFGLHPGQLDTIMYTYTNDIAPITTVTTSISRSIGTDSMAIITSLGSGTYTSFVVKTAGVCSYALPGSFTISHPKIYADFDSMIHYGCQGDTLFYNNLSHTDSAADSNLTYFWTFGDSYTDTAKNPKHLYYPTNNASYTVKMYITNSKCHDSSISNITLNNFVIPSFTFSPAPFVCQLTPVTFTNTSTGTNLSYLWDFGDGVTDVTPSPVHAFTNTGTYKIKLIAADHVLPPPPQFFSPCYDTAYGSIDVDSISSAAIEVTDSVICRGQAITFSGVYSHIGDTLVSWTFGDGNGTVNRDPIQHSFDIPDTFTVWLDIKYRACPERMASHHLTVFDVPSIYLGPDTSLCPGSNAIVIKDDMNANIPGAKWKWNTGDRTPSIVVTKPGYYSTAVTINGCTSSDTVWVQKDCYVDIPNVFSPNGDGVNDYFFPRQILSKGVVKFKMNIYNRWGQAVYETDGTDGRGWDGMFNNKPQPEGVYVYIIDVTFKDGEIEHHQGNITLLR